MKLLPERVLCLRSLMGLKSHFTSARLPGIEETSYLRLPFAITGPPGDTVSCDGPIVAKESRRTSRRRSQLVSTLSYF